MNFKPSRSDERRMNELQRKPNQLGMERMWRVTAHGGQESRTKDVSVFPNSSCIYFQCIALSETIFFPSAAVRVWLESDIMKGQRQLPPDSFFAHSRLISTLILIHAVSHPPLHYGFFLPRSASLLLAETWFMVNP